jgi:hypothetical protein
MIVKNQVLLTFAAAQIGEGREAGERVKARPAHDFPSCRS